MTETPIGDNVPLDDAVPRQSKYLAKEDVTPDVLATVSHMTMDDIEADNKIERRAVLHFHGDLKPLILNQTNKELLKAVTGETTAGGIKNKQIVLYNDPTIMFGGKLTGGIRIRAPKNQPATPVPELNDDIPF